MYNETTIVSAFPGTGKTHYTYGDYVPQGFASDSDSSQFRKNELFPFNYVDHIKGKFENKEHKIIFVSTHKLIREAMRREGLLFTLVYPMRGLRHEYIKRYYDRGSAPEFIDLLNKNWDAWLSDLESQTGCAHIVLGKGEFISNVM